MPKLWKHMVVAFLLLLFVGESGMAVAAGLMNCDGRCGCCNPLQHRSTAARTMTSDRDMGAPMHRVGSHAQSGCCMPSLLSDCGQDQARNPALISTPMRTGQQTHLRLNATAISADGCAAVGRASLDPYAAPLLTRTTTIPIYLQTAVFLC